MDGVLKTVIIRMTGPKERELPEIANYPGLSEISIRLRPLLHPLFKGLKEGISEFTFANIYLFRKTHNYRICRLDGVIVITGMDNGAAFFMLPFGAPGKEALDRLFNDFSFMKGAGTAQASFFSKAGYTVTEDRDNFDYIYLRQELSMLAGRKFHKKKNLVNHFRGNYDCEMRPLLERSKKDALAVLDGWRAHQSAEGDYGPAREAIEFSEEIGLCGGVYYIGERPVAYTQGEELKDDTFVIHFEKSADEYKGLLQHVNQSFATSLPERYTVINREQDLGEPGLRKSKLSYRPAGFIKKYRVRAGRV